MFWTVWCLFPAQGASLFITGIGALSLPGAQFQSMDPQKAVQELYAGRADIALVDRAVSPPPVGIGPVLYIPIASVSVSVWVHLPIPITLSIGQLCDIFAGRWQLWSEINPEWPRIPIWTVVRNYSHFSQYTVGQSCNHWDIYWQKYRAHARWQAGAVFVAENERAYGQFMNQMGAIGFSQPVPGLKRALLRAPGGRFVGPETSTYGVIYPHYYPSNVPMFPKSPEGLLPEVNQEGVYPLRGVVWAVVLREQKYRNRSLEQANQVAQYVRLLQASPQGAQPFERSIQPPFHLYYGGKIVP
ncbi:MAG: substrate-binding domain-containing protein [Deinococcaceae bacterium]